MVIYNKIIPFKGYDAITLFPFIFARKKPLSLVALNHEVIHLYQQFCVFVSSLFVVFVLIVLFELSFWWLFSAFTVFYVLYGLEYCVRYLLYRNHKEAYKNISFEQEAYLHDKDLGYPSRMNPFSWLKYLFEKSY